MSVSNDIVHVPMPALSEGEAKSPVAQLVDAVRAPGGVLNREAAERIIEADLGETSFSRARLQTIRSSLDAPSSTAFGRAIIDSYVGIVKGRFEALDQLDRKVARRRNLQEMKAHPGAAILRLLKGKAPQPPPAREVLPRADLELGPLEKSEVMEAALTSFLALRNGVANEADQKDTLLQLAIQFGAGKRWKDTDGYGSRVWCRKVDDAFQEGFNKVITGVGIDEEAPWRAFREWAESNYVARGANPWVKVYDEARVERSS